MMSLFIIDDNLDKVNFKKMNNDIKYLLDIETKLKLMDYNIVPIESLNEGDSIILLKKTTLKIYKQCKISHYDNNIIYLKKYTSKLNKLNNKLKYDKESRNNYYIFYKHIHTKKNMMQYLLNALENDTLEINTLSS